jgi:hypothetical protein
MSARFRVVVLGGYGNFGAIISRSVARIDGCEVIVAGRDPRRADAVLDVHAHDFAARLAALSPNLVISTAGPFQGEDYGVARAAIAAGSHYVDIADGRSFVCGIGALDGEARSRGVLVASGASSVPALSGAVVDRYAPEFAALSGIDVGISASSRIPGLATVGSVLTYCGKPFMQWRAGAWERVHGWQGIRRHRFADPPLARWICDCDVPDLEIFPARYRGVRDMRFGAGVELSAVQLGLWSASWLVRARLLKSVVPLGPFLRRAGASLERLGSGRSAMFVRLSGTHAAGERMTRTWELRAEGDEGVRVPCMAAVALARKLAAGRALERGAMACVGLVTLDEYMAELTGVRVRAGVVS